MDGSLFCFLQPAFPINCLTRPFTGSLECYVCASGEHVSIERQGSGDKLARAGPSVATAPGML
jgi:hypothetical protein